MLNCDCPRSWSKEKTVSSAYIGRARADELKDIYSKWSHCSKEKEFYFLIPELCVSYSTEIKCDE